MNNLIEISKVLRQKNEPKKLKGGFDSAIVDLGVAKHAKKAEKKRA
jgi:hypothetical protein